MATDLALLLKRLKIKEKSLKLSSPEMTAAMTNIGTVVMSQTVQNIRANKLVDRGPLMISIKYIVARINKKDSVLVGSFGIPYAAIHEYGFKGIMYVRQHTRRGFNVKAHERNVNVPARPYLRPAFVKHGDLIIDIIRRAVA
jgi:phage gpG-like protein